MYEEYFKTVICDYPKIYIYIKIQKICVFVFNEIKNMSACVNILKIKLTFKSVLRRKHSMYLPKNPSPNDYSYTIYLPLCTNLRINALEQNQVRIHKSGFRSILKHTA